MSHALFNFKMLFDEVQTQRAQQLVENEKSKIFINLYKSVQSLQWESQNYLNIKINEGKN